MAIQFALHCSPVRLALRVLNRTTRTRNHSRSPFTNATSRARLPTLTIAANAARTGRSQGGRTPTHAALSLLARARRTRLGFRIVQASTHRGLLDVKARVGKKDGVLQPRRYRGGMGNSPLCGSRRRTVVSLPARLWAGPALGQPGRCIASLLAARQLHPVPAGHSVYARCAWAWPCDGANFLSYPDFTPRVRNSSIIFRPWVAAQSQTTLPPPPVASASNNSCG